MKNPIKIKKYNAKKIYGKDKNILILLAISVVCSMILFLIGILILANIAVIKGNILSGMDFIVFGVLTLIGPIGFYNHIKANKKRQIEDHLPDFLR